MGSGAYSVTFEAAEETSSRLYLTIKWTEKAVGKVANAAKRPESPVV